MKLKKQTVSLAPTYTTVVGVYDTRQDGGTDLGDTFNVHEDRWVAELYVITKAAVNPANEVFFYAELYEEMTREGIDNEDQLLARVPFRQSTTDPSTAKLPPFIMRQDRNYRIDIRIMSATVDLNGAGLTPTYILEMLYDTKPIDYSQLPPYRCEVPIWKFAQTYTNNTGEVLSNNLDFRLLNEYEIVYAGGAGDGSTSQRLYNQRSTAASRILYSWTGTISQYGQIGDKIIVNDGLRWRCIGLPDAATHLTALHVKLVPVIP